MFNTNLESPSFASRIFPAALAAASSIAILLLAALVLARPGSTVRAASSTDSGSATSPVPVLVELFTSEGCSSCPPADALLAQLDASQFVPGVQAIVLSEHVTYWNSLGWRDPFSAEAYTHRQNEYGERFGLSSVYTPQAVVDGSHELVGSDKSALTRAVKESAARAKLPITVENLQWSGDSVTALVNTGTPNREVTLFAALADESDQSSVSRGENSGRNLRHVAVVRNLVEIRKSSSAIQNQAIQLKLPNGTQPQAKMRVVLFVTDSRTGQVVGATLKTLQR